MLKSLFKGPNAYIAWMVVGAAALFVILWFSGKTTYAKPSFLGSTGTGAVPADVANMEVSSNRRAA